MTKPFKFFNVFLILFYIVLMLGALLTTLIYVNFAFQLDFLEQVLAFIPEEIQICVAYAYGYLTIGFLAEMVPAIADFMPYIMLGLNAIIFVWTLILFIRICRPSKHYAKFRGFTFFVNLLIAAIMGLNAYVAFTKGALNGDIYDLITFIVSAAFVFTFLYHFILNLRGRALAKKESNLDPSSFFGGPQGPGVPPRPPAPPRRPTAPPPPPVRRPPVQ